MIKGAYSDKYKIVIQEHLAKLKADGSKETAYWKQRTKELTRQTNRRRKTWKNSGKCLEEFENKKVKTCEIFKTFHLVGSSHKLRCLRRHGGRGWHSWALEDKKRKKEADEERERKEALAQRKKQQQDATVKFQKRNSHKQKGRKLSGSAAPAVSKDQPSSFHGGETVAQKHNEEIKNDPLVLQRPINQQTELKADLRLTYSSAASTTKTGRHISSDPSEKYKNLNGFIHLEHPTGNNHFSCNGIEKTITTELMQSSVNYISSWSHSIETPGAHCNHNHTSGLKQNHSLLSDEQCEVETEKQRAGEQERLRQEAFGQNSAPKIVCTDYGANQELTDGALPSTMGRSSPAGSLTSLDSLDEVPKASTIAEQGVTTEPTQAGIISKSKRGNSASRRRVKFCDSIEFDDGVVGQLVTHEKQSTKHYINLYNQSLVQQQAEANKSVDVTSVTTLGVVSWPVGATAASNVRSSLKVCTKTLEKKSSYTDSNSQKEPISAKNGPSFSGNPKITPVSVSAQAVRLQNFKSNKSSALKVDGTQIAVARPVSCSRNGHQTQTGIYSSAKIHPAATETTVLDKRDSVKSSDVFSTGNVHVKSKEPYTISAAIDTSHTCVESNRGTVQDSLELLSDSLDESDSNNWQGTSSHSSDNCIARENVSDHEIVKNYHNLSSVSHLLSNEIKGERTSFTEKAEINSDNTASKDNIQSSFVNQVIFSSPATVATAGNKGLSNYAPDYTQTQNYFEFESHPTHFSDKKTDISDSPRTTGIQTSSQNVAAVYEQTNNALHFQSWLPRSNTVSTQWSSQMYSHSVFSMPTQSPLPKPVLSQPSILHANQPVSSSYYSQTALSHNEAVSKATFNDSSSSRMPDTCSLTSVYSVPENPTECYSSSSTNAFSSHTKQESSNTSSGLGFHSNTQAPISYVIPNDHQDVKRNEKASLRSVHLEGNEPKRSQKVSRNRKPPTGMKSTGPKQSNARNGKDKPGKQISRKRTPKNNNRPRSSPERQTKKTSQTTNKTKSEAYNNNDVVDDQVMKHIVEDMGKITLQNRLNPAFSVIPTTVTAQNENSQVDFRNVQEQDKQFKDFVTQQGNPHEPQCYAGHSSVNRRVHIPRASSATVRTHPNSIERRASTEPSKKRSQSAGIIYTNSDPNRTLSQPNSQQGGRATNSKVTLQTKRTNIYVPYTTGMEAWSANNGPPGNLQSPHIQHPHESPPQLKQSVSLDKTPTDEEINYLWDRVRVCLGQKNTQSAGSDSCVNRIDVRHSRTASGPSMPKYNQTPVTYFKGSATPNLHRNTSSTSTLKRYGSYDCLQRYGSNDSINMRRTSLLQQRAARVTFEQNSGMLSGQPYHYHQQFGPTPSRQGPAQTASTRTRGQQPLSEAEMRAVMKASHTNQRHAESSAQGNQYNDYQQQQYQALIGARKEPSALSLEEQKLLESLDRLNERLRVQQVVTNQLAHKTRECDSNPANQPQMQRQPRPPPKRQQRATSARVKRSPQSASPVKI